MTCEVLVSTMNRSSYEDLKNNMNINKCTIINQITKDIVSHDYCTEDVKFLNFHEKGLSKSRNNALMNASGDICLLADDDMFYVPDYEKIVLDAFNKYPNADIIAFVVPHENRKSKKVLKEGKINWLNLMKIQSVQLSFKRDSIINNNLLFDPLFGAGTNYYCGEESIFLSDCKKKNLNIIFFPKKIAQLRDTGESTWFKGYDEQFFNTRGAIFYRMSPILCYILILQFAIRKYKLYKNEFGFFNSIKCMIKGRNNYKIKKKALK